MAVGATPQHQHHGRLPPLVFIAPHPGLPPPSPPRTFVEVGGRSRSLSPAQRAAATATSSNIRHGRPPPPVLWHESHGRRTPAPELVLQGGLQLPPLHLAHHHGRLPATESRRSADRGGVRHSATQKPWAAAAPTPSSAATRADAAALTLHFRRGRRRPPVPIPRKTGGRHRRLVVHPARMAAAFLPVAFKPRAAAAATHSVASARPAAATGAFAPASRVAAGDPASHIGRAGRQPPLLNTHIMGGSRRNTVPRTTRGFRHRLPAHRPMAPQAATPPHPHHGRRPPPLLLPP